MFDLFKKKQLSEQRDEIRIVEKYDDVTAIAAYFKEQTGVSFDKQTSILKNKVSIFCRQRKIYAFSDLLDKISYETVLRQELIDHLTTNETFFYREFKQIEEIVTLVKGLHTDVRILCAPSATGEEPYSIAIALLEAGISKDHLSIVGIDINSDAIEKAQEAIYKEQNVRNLSQAIRQRYFTQRDGDYLLDKEIKTLVTFRQINLFDPAFLQLGRFDIILSRNMLIYFDQKTKIKAKRILETLRKDQTRPIFFGHADLF